MNGCPHSFSFALPVPPCPAVPLASPPPLLFSLLILDCSCPSPPLPLPSSSYLCPLLLRHPHYYSLSGAPLSLSLLTERFHRRRFFSRLVAVCRLSLYRILSSTGAPRTKRALLLSALPGSALTSVLLFLRRSARLLSRARTLCFAIIHYVFCTFCTPRSFSLFPRFYQGATFSPAISLPPASSLPIVPECVRLISRAIPNLV